MADKYDLYIQGVPANEIVGFRFLTRRFNRTAGVRGMDKLVIKWMHVLLTPKGTDPTNLDRGTEFTRLVGSNIVSANDVRDVVVLSIQECNNQIFDIQRRVTADSDETLRNAVLATFSQTAADRFDVTVNLTNVAGQSLAVPIPNLMEAS
jgi:hypothetical protein